MIRPPGLSVHVRGPHCIAVPLCRGLDQRKQKGPMLDPHPLRVSVCVSAWLIHRPNAPYLHHRASPSGCGCSARALRCGLGGWCASVVRSWSTVPISTLWRNTYLRGGWFELCLCKNFATTPKIGGTFLAIFAMFFFVGGNQFCEGHAAEINFFCVSFFCGKTRPCAGN